MGDKKDINFSDLFEESKNNSDNKTFGSIVDDELEDKSSLDESKDNMINSSDDGYSVNIFEGDSVVENEDIVSEKKESSPFLNDIKDEPVESSGDLVNSFFSDDKKEEINNFALDEGNPFFDNDTLVKEEVNPFFDNSIDLDQKKKFDSNNKIDVSSAKHFNVKVVKKKEPLIKFVLGVLSYAIFIWLLLIGITLLIYVADIKLREMKGDYAPPKYNAYVVLTGSMLPKIQVYDVVVTKKVEPADLEVDDIITFASSDTRFEGTIITHRIINTYYDAATDTYTFQTKGDNNNVADSALVQSNNIYGKVILKIPKLGYLQNFLAGQGGWIIVILIPCLVVMSYDIVRLIKSVKGKKYKKLKVTK